MKPLLDITDVSLSYHSLSGETPALSHISFQLMPGEFLAIVGPSGCGKSTLLNLICGLLRPEQGQILLDGTPVTSGDCRIGYMLQKDHLLEWRTIYKNVLLGLEIRRELTAEKLAYVNQLLSDYGLDKFRSAHPSELSGNCLYPVLKHAFPQIHRDYKTHRSVWPRWYMFQDYAVLPTEHARFQHHSAYKNVSFCRHGLLQPHCLNLIL